MGTRRRRSIITMSATLIAAMLAVIPAASAQPGTDVLAGEDALSEVSIDVNPTDPDNLVIVGHDDTLSTMNTFYSTNGGATWTTVRLGNAQDGLTSTFRFDPAVAFDDSGNVYAVYGVGLSSPTRTTVVVAKSTDGGATYTQFAQLATDNDIGGLPGNDKWMVATGPDPTTPSQQNVYVAWTRNIEEPGIDQRIVVSTSTDGGATFSAPLTINDASIAGTSVGNLFADPGVGPNGELYVAWNDINGNRVMFDSSTDAGVTWGTDVQVTTSNTGFKTPIPAQPDRGIFVGPTLDTDRTGAFPGRIYVTYTDAGAGAGGAQDIDVYVRTSTDGGATWSARVLVNDDGGSGSQFLPWLDIDQATGLATAVWYDTRNDATHRQAETFVSVSHDGGATWSTNTLVADNPSDMSTNNGNRYRGNYLEYIGIAAYDCALVPVWSDNSEDGGDIDYYVDPFEIEDGLCAELTDISLAKEAQLLATGDDDDDEECFDDDEACLVEYTLTVTNNGPGNANNVVVNDGLPDGLAFDSALASVGAYDANTGVWTVGPLANGGSETLTIFATTVAEDGDDDDGGDDDECRMITNDAQASSELQDPDPSNNSASATLLIGEECADDDDGEDEDEDDG